MGLEKLGENGLGKTYSGHDEPCRATVQYSPWMYRKYTLLNFSVEAFEILSIYWRKMLLRVKVQIPEIVPHL